MGKPKLVWELSRSAPRVRMRREYNLRNSACECQIVTHGDTSKHCIARYVAKWYLSVPILILIMISKIAIPPIALCVTTLNTGGSKWDMGALK
eukprot:2963082-Pleurochrysis_carterae.AAC.1